MAEHCLQVAFPFNGTDLKPITTPTAVKKWRSLDFPDSTDWGPLKR